MEVLEQINDLYESSINTEAKVDRMYELIFKELNPRFKIPEIPELLKIGKKISRQLPHISKLKLTDDGRFQFLVQHNAGCYGNWCDIVTMSPFIFYVKFIAKNEYLLNKK